MYKNSFSQIMTQTYPNDHLLKAYLGYLPSVTEQLREPARLNNRRNLSGQSQVDVHLCRPDETLEVDS